MSTGRLFFRFCLVGLLNTVVNYGAFAGLLALRVHYLASSSIGFLAGVVTSYAINRRWTFASQTQAHWGEISRFLTVNLLALGSNALGMYAGVEWLHWPARLAWCVAIGLSLNVNFFGSKLWVFRRASS